MDIKNAALSLNQFDRALSSMPNNTLKRALKQHVHDAYQLLLEECIQRNASRNFALHSNNTEKHNDNPCDNTVMHPSERFKKSS